MEIHMRFDPDQLFRLSAAQYLRLLEHKILDAAYRLELLEGLVFENMPRSPSGNPVTRAFEESVSRSLPADWEFVCSPVLPLARSKPESAPQPDYTIRHARSAAGAVPACATGIGGVIEIASASPELERIHLGRIYARAEIPLYWVLDYATQVIEVYSQPSGPIESPHYAKRDRYPVGTTVPIVLDGNTVGTIAVTDVMG